YLNQHIGERLRLGDLYNRFGPMIPIEQAFRIAVNNKKLPDDTDAGRMRWVTLRHRMSEFDFDYDPPPTHGRAMSPDAFVIVKGKNCIACGKPFVAVKETLACSKECGSKSRAVRSTSRFSGRNELSSVLVDRIEVGPGLRDLDP